MIRFLKKKNRTFQRTLHKRLNCLMYVNYLRNLVRLKAKYGIAQKLVIMTTEHCLKIVPKHIALSHVLSSKRSCFPEKDFYKKDKVPDT